MSKKIILSTCAGFALMHGASAITIGFGPALVTPVVDTQSNGTNNQMRQNINITDTVFLAAGTYHATTWSYNAAPDATNGATQPVFPFLTIVNGPANHTVLAFGDTIDTEPGIQDSVLFGGENASFTIPSGGATVAAGIQNTNAPSVQNSIQTDLSLGKTDHANSGNVDEAGSVGASLNSFGHANLTRTYGFSIEVATGAGDEKIPLSIANSGADLRFEWESKPDMFYNMRTTTDLESDPATWDPVNVPGSVENDGVFDISSDSPLNVHVIPRPADGVRFYRVEEYPIPPMEIFSEHFDDITPGFLPTDWTSGKNAADTTSTTNWELGTPAGVGPVPPGVPLPSADRCIATGIGSNYFVPDPEGEGITPTTDIWLRTSSIDLGAATAGTLNFQQWTQIEDVAGDLDYGSIRILDASDNSELAVMEDQTIDGSTTGWEDYSMALPAAAFNSVGGAIKVEFRFEADDLASFAGWYIDDVTVTTP